MIIDLHQFLLMRSQLVRRTLQRGEHHILLAAQSDANRSLK
jgi:hypothetical protein